MMTAGRYLTLAEMRRDCDPMQSAALLDWVRWIAFGWRRNTPDLRGKLP